MVDKFVDIYWQTHFEGKPQMEALAGSQRELQAIMAKSNMTVNEFGQITHSVSGRVLDNQRSLETLTRSTQRFKMEWLGIMFFGMAIERQFGAITQKYYETMGATDMMNIAIQDFMFEAGDPMVDFYYDLADAMLNLPDDVKQSIGSAIVAMDWTATGMAVAGQIALGLASMKMVLGPGSWEVAKSMLIPGLGMLAGGILTVTGLLSFTNAEGKLNMLGMLETAFGVGMFAWAAGLGMWSIPIALAFTFAWTMTTAKVDMETVEDIQRGLQTETALTKEEFLELVDAVKSLATVNMDPLLADLSEEERQHIENIKRAKEVNVTIQEFIDLDFQPLADNLTSTKDSLKKIADYNGTDVKINMSAFWNTEFAKGNQSKGFDIWNPTTWFGAEGGIVSRPTLSMIGEAGPEAVIPLDKMNSMGTNIENISIYVDAKVSSDTDIDALARKLGDKFSDELRRIKGGR